MQVPLPLLYPEKMHATESPGKRATTRFLGEVFGAAKSMASKAKSTASSGAKAAASKASATKYAATGGSSQSTESAKSAKSAESAESAGGDGSTRRRRFSALRRGVGFSEGAKEGAAKGGTKVVKGILSWFKLLSPASRTATANLVEKMITAKKPMKVLGTKWIDPVSEIIPDILIWAFKRMNADRNIGDSAKMCNQPELLVQQLCDIVDGLMPLGEINSVLMPNYEVSMPSRIGVISPQINIFVVRSSQAWLDQGGYSLSGGQFYHAHKWVDCVLPPCASASRHVMGTEENADNEDIKYLMKAKKNPDFKFDNRACNLTDGHNAYPGEERYNIESQVDRCNTQYAPPTCAVRITWQLTRCNTCCCTDTAAMKLAVTQLLGTTRACGSWMTTLDYLVRLIGTTWRQGVLLMWYTGKCFDRA